MFPTVLESHDERKEERTFGEWIRSGRLTLKLATADVIDAKLRQHFPEVSPGYYRAEYSYTKDVTPIGKVMSRVVLQYCVTDRPLAPVDTACQRCRTEMVIYPADLGKKVTCGQCGHEGRPSHQVIYGRAVIEWT